jgi:GTP-binding protein
MTIKIAIDGPSGTGKSSTAKGIAARAGWQYLDTGALYRMATIVAIEQGEMTENNSNELLSKNSFEVSLDPANQIFLLNGDDVSQRIRSEEVTSVVSKVAAIKAVRTFLLTLQHQLIDKATSGIVVEGRDIGSTVIPEADFKIYLDADPVARGMRRANENGSNDVSSQVKQLEERDSIDSNRSTSPLTLAPDAIFVDSTNFNLEETIEHIWEEMVSRSIVGLPKIAVIGRPNVGKSTLINRLIGRNDAITEDRPGITRDRVFHRGSWNRVDFILVDTGGWERSPEGIGLTIAESSELAIDEADFVLLVVDGKTGVIDDDTDLVEIVRRSGKSVFLVVNKVDNEIDESSAHIFWNLGLGEPHFISALHGRGSGDVLDKLVSALPKVGRGRIQDGIPNIAIIGKPNVGKSSLLNAITGVTRSLVDDSEGTTRDPIDEIVDLEGTQYRFIDTAGIRRRSHQSEGADFYSVLRSEKAIAEADLVLMIIDSSKTITEQDQRLIALAEESGASIVVVMNKWDLVDEERRIELDKEIERAFRQIEWAERINISAKTGWHKNRLEPAIAKALRNRAQRVPTSRLNALVGSIVAANPLPVRSGKQARIKYCTQVSVSPPTFVIFSTDFIEASYRRFIERRLREVFGFEGSPIRISVRLRDS